jgi:hypothetical protein
MDEFHTGEYEYSADRLASRTSRPVEISEARKSACEPAHAS